MKGLSELEKKELLPSNLIFLGYRGSIAHGMYIPNTNPTSIDDKDIIGVYTNTISHYLGIYQEKDVKEKWYKEWDCIYYELLKIVRLLLKGNPNVLSILWLDEKYVIYKNKFWEELVSIKEAFSSKQIYHSFYGYAHGQFHRMTHCKFEGYMGEKRKNLVTQYGYDCKNAAHLIRLLKMGIEFLTEGVLYVERKNDATQLLEIKKGEWSLEQVKTEAEKLFKLCEEAYIHSTLPNKPNEDLINKTCISILKEVV
jgi:uncharacterized protein